MRVSPIVYFARKSYRYKLVDRDTTGKNVLCTPYLYVLCIWMMAEVHKNKSSWILRVNWDHIDIDCNFFLKYLKYYLYLGIFGFIVSSWLRAFIQKNGRTQSHDVTRTREKSSTSISLSKIFFPKGGGFRRLFVFSGGGGSSGAYFW